jgi:hypothetical protein
MIITLFRKLGKSPSFNKDVSQLWEEYLSKKPSTGELTHLFFLNKKEKINELAWKEIKSRSDIKNRDLLEVILFCSKPEWIVAEAWKMLSTRNPEEHELERIVRSLGVSHPISCEIEVNFGRNKEHSLRNIRNLV